MKKVRKCNIVGGSVSPMVSQYPTLSAVSVTNLPEPLNTLTVPIAPAVTSIVPTASITPMIPLVTEKPAVPLTIQPVVPTTTQDVNSKSVNEELPEEIQEDIPYYDYPPKKTWLQKYWWVLLIVGVILIKSNK